ncbi:MAG TPA: UDP-2,3-diacylglucosamine diphosphatase [Candidatus Sulfotelmatobacter sp.]|nr:UDP-2,3-diacylglucosamine diphosphatase [Candidatus Sulfotelmatobacter sp.]
MDLPACNTLILSDLHLGAETSRAREATRVLKHNRFERLILLGDIFADLNFARLTKEHWKFLGCIRKLSNPKRRVEVVWVEGNHDYGLANIMSHLVGVRVYDSYEWRYQGMLHIAIHGHQFDGFQVNRVRLSRWGTSLYLQLQKLDFKSKPIARLIDRLNTRWLRMSAKVTAGALAYARHHGAGRIFCGHTHEALEAEQNGICYYNSGGWVGSRLTYLTIDEEGVRIHDYQHEYGRRIDHRDPDEERGEADSAIADFADESGLFKDVEYEHIGR